MSLAFCCNWVILRVIVGTKGADQVQPTLSCMANTNLGQFGCGCYCLHLVSSQSGILGGLVEGVRLSASEKSTEKGKLGISWVYGRRKVI